MKKFLMFPAVALIASCGPAQNDPGPGGVTVGEAKALDDAAEMLDDRNSLPEPSTEVVSEPGANVEKSQ